MLKVIKAAMETRIFAGDAVNQDSQRKHVLTARRKGRMPLPEIIPPLLPNMKTKTKNQTNPPGTEAERKRFE